MPSDIMRQISFVVKALGIDYRLVRWARGDYKKPNPYMLNDIMSIAGAEATETLFVGDQDTDKDAASNAGCGFMYANEFAGCDI